MYVWYEAKKQENLWCSTNIDKEQNYNKTVVALLNSGGKKIFFIGFYFCKPLRAEFLKFVIINTAMANRWFRVKTEKLGRILKYIIKLTFRIVTGSFLVSPLTCLHTLGSTVNKSLYIFRLCSLSKLWIIKSTLLSFSTIAML